MISNTWFAKMAQRAAKATGSSPAFLTVCLLTLVWLYLEILRLLSKLQSRR